MQPNYNHNQGPIHFFPPLEANYHITRGVCLLNSNPPFFLFLFFLFLCEHSRLRRTLKQTNKKIQKTKKSVLFENVKLMESFIFVRLVFITGAQFETHDAPAITVTAYYNAP